MERKQFEAEVHDFCRLYLSDILSEWNTEFNDSRVEPDFDAIITFQIGRNRKYEINLIPHPDDKGDIAINTGEDNYLSADAGGLYAWLWQETMRMEDEIMDKTGMMRMADGEVRAKFFVGSDFVWLEMHQWMDERRKLGEKLKLTM